MRRILQCMLCTGLALVMMLGCIGTAGAEEATGMVGNATERVDDLLLAG